MFLLASSLHGTAEQRGLLFFKEPAITPDKTEALDNAQYMQSNEVDSYYFVIWLFNLKCCACFFVCVDMLVTKTHMKICCKEMRYELFELFVNLNT